MHFLNCLGISRKQVEVIEPQVATCKLTWADFTQQAKAYWFAQNWKQQPLVAQVRRLPSLRKGDSLKVGQPAPLSSRMIGQPLSYWRKGLRCFHLQYKVKAGKARGVISRFSTKCYLTYRIFPPDSIIQDHLPVAWHSVQDPIWHTCILSIVRTNKDIKRHHIYFIPEYCRHLVTWHLAASHTLHTSLRPDFVRTFQPELLMCVVGLHQHCGQGILVHALQIYQIPKCWCMACTYKYEKCE